MRGSIILAGILVLGLVLVVGCSQKPAEVELETKELLPLEEMVPLEPMAEETQPIVPRPPSEEKTTSATVTGKININIATKAQIQSLPRIGATTAEAIVANRPYKTIEEITRVPRIGDKTFENLKDLITVGETVAPVVPVTQVPTEEKVVIPVSQEPAEPELKKEDTDGDGIPDTWVIVGTKPAPTASATAASAAAAGKININTATKAQIQSLPRVGAKTAEAIIANRPYQSIEEITRVPRIGSKTFENLKDFITVE